MTGWFAAITVGVAIGIIVAFDYANPPEQVVVYKRPTLAQVVEATKVGLRQINSEARCERWMLMPELTER